MQFLLHFDSSMAQCPCYFSCSGFSYIHNNIIVKDTPKNLKGINRVKLFGYFKGLISVQSISSLNGYLIGGVSVDQKELRFIQKAVQGNQRAMTKLLEKHYERLYLLAYSYMKNEADSLDVVQEASFRAFQKISSLKQDEYFLTWMHRIVINECNRLLAKKQKEQAQQTSDVKLNDLSDQKDFINQRIASSELLTYIQQLDEKYEEVLLLFYYNDLSIKEISQFLNKSENTIKTRLSRGRSALKTNLEIANYKA